MFKRLINLFSSNQKNACKEAKINNTPIRIPSQEELTNILKNIEKSNAYYVGGTLFIGTSELDIILTINLNETFGSFADGFGGKLNEENSRLAFFIYRRTKGQTYYYWEKILASKHVNHKRKLLIEKRNKFFF